MGRGAKGRGGGGRSRGHAHRSHASHKHHGPGHAHHHHMSAHHRHQHVAKQRQQQRRQKQRQAFLFRSHRSRHRSRPLTPAERLAMRINQQEEIPTGIGSLYLNGSGRSCCGDKAHTVAERQLPVKFTDLLSQAEWDAFITKLDRAFDEEECPTLLAALCCLPTLMVSCCIADCKATALHNKLTAIIAAENHRLQPVGLQWVRTPGRAPAMLVLRWLPGLREPWEQANPHRRPVSREPPAREFLPNALQLQMGMNELAGRPAFAVLTPPPQMGAMQMMFGQQPMGAGPPQQTMAMEMQPMQGGQMQPMQQQQQQPMMMMMQGGQMQPMQPMQMQPMQGGQMQMQSMQPQLMQPQLLQPPPSNEPVFSYVDPMPLLSAEAAAEGGGDVPEGLPMQQAQPMQAGQPMHGQPMQPQPMMQMQAMQGGQPMAAGAMLVQPVSVVQPVWSPPVYSAHPHGFGQAPLPVYAPSQGPALYCTGCGAPRTLHIDDGPKSNECESCGQVLA